ncbi:hypothetical protein [Desulfovibrio desulfuricans]|nr:hypothetical protein [Desulfovibrio desulfuricans]
MPRRVAASAALRKRGSTPHLEQISADSGSKIMVCGKSRAMQRG